MLVMLLRYDGTLTSRTGELRGLVTCARDSPSPDYRVSLGRDVARTFARGTLHQYARWSEPIRALIARSIHAAMNSFDEPFELPCRSLQLLVYDWRTSFLVDRIEVNCSSVGAEPGQAFSKHQLLAQNPWEAAFFACAFDTFGTTRLPTRPRRMTLKVYHQGGVRYCRTSELPLEARVVAEQVLPRKARPLVPRIPDAVFPWALEAFLANQIHSRPSEATWTWP
jgi:hypothetical protein